MVSKGDEIDVLDFGVCKLNEEGKHIAYLIEEEDSSITWVINPDYQRESILTTRNVDFVKER